MQTFPDLFNVLLNKAGKLDKARKKKLAEDIAGIYDLMLQEELDIVFRLQEALNKRGNVQEHVFWTVKINSLLAFTEKLVQSL